MLGSVRARARKAVIDGASAAPFLNNTEPRCMPDRASLLKVVSRVEVNPKVGDPGHAEVRCGARRRRKSELRDVFNLIRDLEAEAKLEGERERLLCGKGAERSIFEHRNIDLRGPE